MTKVLPRGGAGRFGRSGPLGLLTGHAATSVLYDLYRHGILGSLTEWRTARAVATAHKLNVQATAVTLDFLSRVSDVSVRRQDVYRLRRNYRQEVAWRAMLEKFGGAGEPVVRSAVESLKRPNAAGRRINEPAFERAFRWDVESPAVIELITGLRPEGVLDLGCGRGTLLVDVCGKGVRRGWGVDTSASMCRAARAEIASAGLECRIAIMRGDALCVGRFFTTRERRTVSLIHAGSILNEFAQDEVTLVAVLRRFVSLFRNRWLVAVDYLGALGTQSVLGGRRPVHVHYRLSPRPLGSGCSTELACPVGIGVQVGGGTSHTGDEGAYVRSALAHSFGSVGLVRRFEKQFQVE